MNIVNKYDKFIENQNLNLIQSFLPSEYKRKTSGQKIQINSQKVTLPTSPPLPYSPTGNDKETVADGSAVPVPTEAYENV